MASFSLDIDTDFNKVNKMLSGMAKKEVSRAAARAINRTLPAIKKEAAPELLKQLGVGIGITQAGLRKAMKIKRARANNLIGMIITSGRRLPLIRFGARKVKTGVTHTAWGKRQTLQGAFIAQGTGARGKQVFKRTGGSKRLMTKGRYAGTGIKREPIEKKYGPSIPGEFLDKDVLKAMDRIGRVKWPINFQRELNFYLKKFK